MTDLCAARASTPIAAAAFELAWQREGMQSLHAQLATPQTPAETIGMLAEWSARFLRADTATVFLYDAGQRRYRLRAVAGSPLDATHWPVAGCDLPRTFPAVAQTVARGMIILPTDDPRSLLARLLADAAHTALYVALRFGGEVIGILTVLRSATEPFGVSDRLIARGIADQAALALATARLQDDVRRAHRMRSDVMGIVSHELRTPLTTILGFAEVLRESTGDGEVRQYVARIETAGRSLLDSVESMITFGKLTTAQEGLEVNPIAFCEFWGRLGAECAGLGRRPAVALRWEPAVPEAVLRTDVAKLASVVRHLVRNALKFTEHGTVCVDARVRGHQLRVRVRDTGIGIAPKHQTRIFEPFWQVDSSTTRQHGGIGLGLYVVRRFVTQLGGTVTVQSGTGAGALFTVMLPSVIDRAADRRVRGGSRRSSDVQPRVLGRERSTARAEPFVNPERG